MMLEEETTWSQRGIIPDKAFHECLTSRLGELMGLLSFVTETKDNADFFTRPILGRLLSEARQAEEFLDLFGANQNARWKPIRFHVATILHFANISYIILHIKYTSPGYMLLEVEGDFPKDTEAATDFLADTLRSISGNLVLLWNDFGLPVQRRIEYDDPRFSEWASRKILSPNLTNRKAGAIEEVVVQIATAFLSLEAKSDLLHVVNRCQSPDFKSYLPKPVNEESLRILEQQFHSLQSLYDTYVSGSIMESADPNLKVLRGHISVIFHLLEGTIPLVHYYLRHILPKADMNPELIVDTQRLLHTLHGYLLTYSLRYLLKGKSLSQEMLKNYAEEGTIKVPVPKYRGFHVRPSTLVSKIVLHYGSNVTMKLQDEVYDARVPLNFFRANEKINAIKRRRLTEQIAQKSIIQKKGGDADLKVEVYKVIMALSREGKIVLYEQPLKLEVEHLNQSTNLLEFTVKEITRLLAQGKIDIDAAVEVTFNGDKRVLADIQLLAENGYGEDSFGNNIDLPEELTFLRH